MINKLDKNYAITLSELKDKVRKAQVKASLAVNTELIQLYWEIGKTISEQQTNHGWGTKIVEKLSKDLQKEFPDMRGFSLSNLFYMRKFYQSYQDVIILQQPAGEIPWWHNVILMEKVKDKDERFWYAQQTIENGWSRNVLVMQIESGLYKRQITTTKSTNFKNTLPSPQSDLAQQLMKDPYNFDFLTIAKDAHEKEIEKQLVNHIKSFLLELGAGFSFVGEQYHLDIGGDDFYIDLLFYHLKLRCYVVIELKNGKFIPEYAGKLNFYLSAVDDILKHKTDNPTIGLLLCKSKNRVTAEYSLKDISKPIGISDYKLTEAIPENLKSSLPTIEELETEFRNDEKK
jgi:predicted nuclease of restriction endonuclease-like (RecB) superfamily